jgi:hypothetical protein
MHANGTGQSSLPTSCPVCEHTPVAAEDCKPLKTLRTTIKVFLRTEEKKREASRVKELKVSPPVTPVTPVESISTPTIPQALPYTTSFHPKDESSGAPTIEPSTTTEQIEQIPTIDAVRKDFSIVAQQDIPQKSIEVMSYS